MASFSQWMHLSEASTAMTAVPARWPHFEQIWHYLIDDDEIVYASAIIYTRRSASNDK